MSELSNHEKAEKRFRDGVKFAIVLWLLFIAGSILLAVLELSGKRLGIIFLGAVSGPIWVPAVIACFYTRQKIEESVGVPTEDPQQENVQPGQSVHKRVPPEETRHPRWPYVGKEYD